MSGFSMNIELDDRDMQRMLNGLLSLGQNLSPVLDDVGAHVEMSTKERFETNIGPSGDAWQQSRRAAAQGGKTLLDRDSVQRSPATDDEVVIGTNIIYAAIHQFGGVIRPKNAKKLAFKTPFGMAFLDQVTIPARPMFGLSAEDEQIIPEIVFDHVREAVNGR